MRSKVLTKDHEALIGLYKAMTPRQKINAFLNHSRLVYRVYQAGKAFRKLSAKSEIKKAR